MVRYLVPSSFRYSCTKLRSIPDLGSMVGHIRCRGRVTDRRASVHGSYPTLHHDTRHRRRRAALLSDSHVCVLPFVSDYDERVAQDAYRAATTAKSIRREE